VTNPRNIEILEPDENEGYGQWKLPCSRDEEIAEVVLELSQGRMEGRQLSERYAPVLRAFAERMANLARRHESARDLRLGLDALAIAVLLGESREAILIMPLLWRSAEVLELDPAKEFTKAADRHDVKELRAFIDRQPEDRSIESMGYVETHDESGFSYERNW